MGFGLAQYGWDVAHWVWLSSIWVWLTPAGYLGDSSLSYSGEENGEDLCILVHSEWEVTQLNKKKFTLKLGKTLFLFLLLQAAEDPPPPPLGWLRHTTDFSYAAPKFTTPHLHLIVTYWRNLPVCGPLPLGCFIGVFNSISIIYLSRVLCLSVCVCVCVTICVGTLCYSFSFSNQTDQGYQTEGLEREG
jgi:hypothetical protein